MYVLVLASPTSVVLKKFTSRDNNVSSFLGGQQVLGYFTAQKSRVKGGLGPLYTILLIPILLTSNSSSQFGLVSVNRCNKTYPTHIV